MSDFDKFDQIRISAILHMCVSGQEDDDGDDDGKYTSIRAQIQALYRSLSMVPGAMLQLRC